MKTKIKLKNFYLIGIITIGLISLGVGSTFAMFTASTTINNPIVFNSNLEGNNLLTETVEVTVLPGEEQIINLIVNNVTSSDTYYSAWYISDSNYLEEGCSTSNNSYNTTGALPSSTNFTLTVTLRNRGRKIINVVLGVSNSTISPIIIPESATIIALRELPKLINEEAATYITNLYTDSTKIQHTDSKYNITYNYAEDVNLMNDRLGSMSTNIDEGNIRYYGGNPNNYVLFNNELWRIIGVFNNKLKIIRNESIGDYSFDTSGTEVNNSNGINQWGPSTHSTDNSIYDGADSMKLLNPGYENNIDKTCKTIPVSNGTAYNCNNNADEDYKSILVNNSLYWNSGKGKCYHVGNYGIKTCDFTDSGLKDEAKNMIAEVTWYLGTRSMNEVIWHDKVTAFKLYNLEHSNKSGIQCTINNSGCSTDVLGTTTWTGKVGLMSPSDFAYATGGGTYGLDTCLSSHAAYVEPNSGVQGWPNAYKQCIIDDWLYKSDVIQMTISPYAISNSATDVFSIWDSGTITATYARVSQSIYPTVFLKADTYLWTGEGTSDNPYTLR